MKPMRELTKHGQPKFTSVHVQFNGKHQTKGVFPCCEEMTAGEIVKKYLIPRTYDMDGEIRTVGQVTMSCSASLNADEGVRAYICKYPIKTDMGGFEFNCCIALSLDFISDYDVAVEIASDVMLELEFACLKEDPKEASDRSLCQKRMFPTDHTIYLASPNDLGKPYID
jgi:hypothetical protein